MKITQIELSKILNCSRANISQQVSQNKLILGPDKLIDTEEPLNTAWLRSRMINPLTLKKDVNVVSENQRKARVKNPHGHEGKSKKIDEIKIIESSSDLLPESKIIQEQPINLKDDFDTLTGMPKKILDLTIRQAVLKYGTEPYMKAYVDILNTLFSAMKKDVDIQEKRRALIEKDFVSAHLFQFLDVMINQIFDYPESAIDEFIAEIKADEKKARLKIPEKMRKDFSKIVNEAKKNITRQIKKLNERHNDDAID